MNPYAVLLMARTLEQDRDRSAADRRRTDALDPTAREESRRSWPAIARFPRFTLSNQRG